MTRYSDLYNHLKNAPCPTTLFEEIKSRYAELVASNRQLDRCKTVGDIVAILEKRDCINLDNYNILEDLYVALRDSSEIPPPTAPLLLPDPPTAQGIFRTLLVNIICATLFAFDEVASRACRVETYCSPVIGTVQNFYQARVRKPCYRKIRELLQSKRSDLLEIGVFLQVPNGLQEKLQYVIATKIGHNWKNFARGLRIPEGQIDELEDRHRTISDRVRDILLYHDRFCPPNFRNSYLFNALCYARRKELANEIQYIIDTH